MPGRISSATISATTTPSARARSTGRSGSPPASKPLPRKIVITNRADEARPQSVSLIDWNLKPTFKDSVFKFTPPKGATKIEIVPRKTK